MFEFLPHVFLFEPASVCVFTEVTYGQCVYSCCGAPLSTLFIVLHVLIGHSGYAETSREQAPSSRPCLSNPLTVPLPVSFLTGRTQDTAH